MNRHALAVLEYPRVLDEVASRTTSALGAERIRQLLPSTDRSWVEREHSRVAAVRALREGDDPMRPQPVPELNAALERLRVAGAAWSPAEMLGARSLLSSARRTRDVLSDDKRPAAARAVLATFAARMWLDKSLEQTLDRSVADDATLKDEASPTLRRLRRELRASEGELIKLLERQLAKLDESVRVADMSVTVRNGRYVIPVRREGRGSVAGIVHDTSASGGTLFVEPQAAVEFGNRIRDLEFEERTEVDRILRELTEQIRPHRVAATDSLDALAELDTLHARAAYAVDVRAFSPVFTAPSEGWSIVDGRHPLLLARGVDVVPFDLEMSANERTIVVSGPNTGGKTVLLKSVGLLSAMAQAGIPPTSGKETRIALFDDYFADIGDEQSIEASLSTFSAHLKNLAEILASATSSSLVLVDELGSGTDPLEGAALGWAILEELTTRGTTTIATSHLGALKELPAQVKGVVNASLQFDAERIAPTYSFVKGIPGRSYGISIARKLRLQESVVARAEERVPSTERDLAALVEKLERQQSELSARDAELSVLLEDAKKRGQELSRRERNVRDREREVERQSRQEARKYLLNARAEIDRTVRDLKKAGASGLDEKAREARKLAEQLAAKQADVIGQLDAEAAKREKVPRGKAVVAAVPGDVVIVESMGGKTGRLIELRDADALVAVGSMKLTVPARTLTRVEPEKIEKAVAWHGDLPEEQVRSEIDLRGMRPDEMESVLLQALDEAIRADLPTLTIIHGKGTGALRERAAEMLRKDTRVRQFRAGAWNEGGTGVTIAELR